jgi:AP-2 complex subunit alpha
MTTYLSLHHTHSYHKKKYVWKLVYIFVLGYDVDFGHQVAINLMLSTKYAEKTVGYAAVSLMVHPTEVCTFHVHI